MDAMDAMDTKDILVRGMPAHGTEARADQVRAGGATMPSN